eukprot:GHVN01081278.1.p1 GENE.GHVN01081278.1~~GHVN01081278.1.p1  ORF type:complete len:653 (+),score=106.24 GHVN01081278.1:145-2103(+)
MGPKSDSSQVQRFEDFSPPVIPGRRVAILKCPWNEQHVDYTAGRIHATHTEKCVLPDEDPDDLYALTLSKVKNEIERLMSSTYAESQPRMQGRFLTYVDPASAPSRLPKTRKLYEGHLPPALPTTTLDSVGRPNFSHLQKARVPPAPERRTEASNQKNCPVKTEDKTNGWEGGPTFYKPWVESSGASMVHYRQDCQFPLAEMCRPRNTLHFIEILEEATFLRDDQSSDATPRRSSSPGSTTDPVDESNSVTLSNHSPSPRTSNHSFSRRTSNQSPSPRTSNHSPSPRTSNHSPSPRSRTSSESSKLPPPREPPDMPRHSPDLIRHTRERHVREGRQSVSRPRDACHRRGPSADSEVPSSEGCGGGGLDQQRASELYHKVSAADSCFVEKNINEKQKEKNHSDRHRDRSHRRRPPSGHRPRKSRNVVREESDHPIERDEVGSVSSESSLPPPPAYPPPPLSAVLQSVNRPKVLLHLVNESTDTSSCHGDRDARAVLHEFLKQTYGGSERVDNKDTSRPRDNADAERGFDYSVVGSSRIGMHQTTASLGEESRAIDTDTGSLEAASSVVEKLSKSVKSLPSQMNYPIPWKPFEGLQWCAIVDRDACDSSEDKNGELYFKGIPLDPHQVASTWCDDNDGFSDYCSLVWSDESDWW